MYCANKQTKLQELNRNKCRAISKLHFASCLFT